jgi:hypothetical protein
VLAFDIQALGEDIIEVAEYAKTMSVEDVNEVIAHILAEVNLFVSHHDRMTADPAPVYSTAMTPSVSLRIEEPMPVLNDLTELPSSCSRNLQTVPVRRGAQKGPRRVSEGLRRTQDRSRPNHSCKSQTDSHDARRSLMRYMQNSPYAEVRAVVDNHDDPNMAASTFRSWVIGTIFVAASGFINQFFSIRYPSIGVGFNVAQLLCVPPSLIRYKRQLTAGHG